MKNKDKQDLLKLQIANKLKETRLKLAITQKEVEKETKIDTSTLSLYEKGERTPSVKRLVELINLYDISADWLLNTNPKRK